MAKMVNEVLGKAKGEDKVNEMLTGKGAFSKSAFGDLVNALANDTTFKIPTYNKDGQKSGEVSVSELLRKDMKESIEKAKYPQKSEAGVLNTSEVCTKGLAEAIPYIVMEQLKSGKKFDLPNTNKSTGSMYRARVPCKKKSVQTRDPKTQTALGSVEITTKDSVQVRAKSPVPEHLTTRVRKDTNGKVVG